MAQAIREDGFCEGLFRRPIAGRSSRRSVGEIAKRNRRPLGVGATFESEIAWNAQLIEGK